MRALVQRVGRAAVRVEGRTVGEIGAGLLVLLGVRESDTAWDAEWLARKVGTLRLFADADGRMNRDVREVGGQVLLVPQFTLYGEARRGRRPDFVMAARAEIAAPLVEHFARTLASLELEVARGAFGARMEVELVNEGPVTLMVESPTAETR